MRNNLNTVKISHTISIVGKKNIIGAVEKYAILSFKHIGIRFAVVIVLFLVLFLLVLKGCYVIDAASVVTITSSISAASGALLALSLALATLFSRHITDWRDTLFQENL